MHIFITPPPPHTSPFPPSLRRPHTDQTEGESLLSSPRMLAVDTDVQFDSPSEGHSDGHSMHSALSTSSSIVDLRDKISIAPPTTSPPPPQLLSTTTASGDFGLRVTAFVPTPEAASRNDWVRLNVGGRVFATTR